MIRFLTNARWATTVVVALAFIAPHAHPSDDPHFDASMRFLQEVLPDVAAGSSDPHLLLLGAVTSAVEGRELAERIGYVERAYAIAPHDPVVLLYLEKFCRQPLELGTLCTGHDWVRELISIDSDNGAPWLRLAALAKAGGDDQGLIRALSEAASRPRYDSYRGRTVHDLYRALHKLAPRGQPLLPAVVWVQAMGIAAAGVNLEVEIVDACTAARQHRVIDLCRRISTQMLDYAYSSTGVLAAAGVLTALPDVSASEQVRVDAIRRHHARMGETMSEVGHLIAQDPDLVERMAEHMGRHGEHRTWLRFFP